MRVETPIPPPSPTYAVIGSMAHSRPAHHVAADLGVRPVEGLSSSEAAERLARFGPNVLVESPGKTRLQIIWEQLTSVLVLVLIAAGVVSLLLGEVIDALAIAAIVLLNAALGFQQQYRAERAMAALKQLAVPLVKVRRDGRPSAVSAHDVVAGDVILLEAGDVVSADARLLWSPNLRVQEASLTGESQPVEKDAEASIEPDAPLADRHTMVYMARRSRTVGPKASSWRPACGPSSVASPPSCRRWNVSPRPFNVASRTSRAG